MKRVIYALFLASLIIIASAAVYTADAQSTVHALLVIMDDDHLAAKNDVGIGPSCAVDQYYIETFLKRLQMTTETSVEIKTLLSSESTATFSHIQQWLNDVIPTSEDVVFIYFSGHGGMNNWIEKRTFLATLDTFTYRDDLINLMKGSTVGARLQMLITDCCSNTTEPPPVQIEKTSGALNSKVFEHLFMQHTGFLDIAGATEGQYSWGINPDPEIAPDEWKEGAYGGTFTHSLITAIEEAPDENSDGFVSWMEVFELTVEKTEHRFNISTFSDETQKKLDRLRITNQTPKAYSLPKSSDGIAPIFPPIQLKGTVVISGTDDEFGDDEYGKLEHDIDLYIRQQQKDLHIPDLRWGGECRVELSLTAQLVDIGKVEIFGKAKLFEGTSEDTTDLADEAQIFLAVPEENETDELKIVATSIDDFSDEESGTSIISPMTLEPVHDSVTLENTEIGGGDKADIVLKFTVEHIDVDTTIDSYRKQAVASKNQKEYTASIANYIKALRLKPYDPDIRQATANGYKARGNTKFKSKDYKEAIADFTKALRLKPDDPNIRQTIANVYEKSGDTKLESKDYEEAIADYTKALRLKSDNVEIDPQQSDTQLFQIAELYNGRAFAKLQLKQYESARADFTEAIRLRPDHYFAYMQRGEANENLNRYKEAKVDYQTALKLLKGTGNTGFEKIIKDALERLK